MSRSLPTILQLDSAGNPTRWITYETAAYYYAKDLVAWTVGEGGFTIYGGENALTGRQSFMDLNTIIAVKGKVSERGVHRTPSLTNKGLFRRDQNICAYCGQEFEYEDLTRDHIIARAKGGLDKWTNVVTACGGCNKYKGDASLEQAGLKLLYLPYAPSRSEHLILMNRHILADQMNFLRAQLPAHSRVLNPIVLN